MEWRYAPYWSGRCESTFTLQLRFHLTMEEEFFSAEEPELGGHDFVFVDELSLGQKCPICLVAMCNPVQTVCGHRFCESCLLGTFRYFRLLHLCK